MKKWAAALLLLLALTGTRAFAQSEALDEAAFWQRLDQTARLLEVASSPDALEGIRELWGDVTAVQAGKETIPVDMRWIGDVLNSGDAESLAALRRHVRALLTAHNSQVQFGRSPATLEALREVLADPRFQYDRQPEAPPPRPLPNVDTNAGNADIFQIVLWVAVGMMTIAVVMYFARALYAQPQEIAPTDEHDEPKTSADAHSRAGERESAGDYRSAIRYLFLALLLLLDERGLLHYDPMLTNREHLKQSAVNARLIDLLRPVVSTFDDVWYGFTPIDETGYRRFAQQIEQIKAFVP